MGRAWDLEVESVSKANVLFQEVPRVVEMRRQKDGLGRIVFSFHHGTIGPLLAKRGPSANIEWLSGSITPITGHHVGVPSHPHHPDPLPSRRLRGGDRSHLAYPCHGFIRCAAASLTPRPPDLHSFATWPVDPRRGRVQSPVVHSLAGEP
jgi:hypothetical protein